MPDREYNRKRREFALKYFGNKCAKCGEDGSKEELQIDHINPDDVNIKAYSSTLQYKGILRLPRKDFLEELKKCQLLCWPCHNEKTIKEQGHKLVTEHGVQMYNHYSCRCDICKKAISEYKRNYYKKKVYGST